MPVCDYQNFSIEQIEMQREANYASQPYIYGGFANGAKTFLALICIIDNISGVNYYVPCSFDGFLGSVVSIIYLMAFASKSKHSIVNCKMKNA